jgi:hypothetical protein
MGNKRIYLGSSTSKYALLIGMPLVTIISLVLVLQSLGFVITGSDDICAGTIDDPCVSYGQICNRGPDNYDIYNKDGLKLDFSPSVKDYWMFFKDGRVRKEFLIPRGVQFSTKGWRFENFTNATKPRKDRVYVHRFPAYKCQDYMIVGLKNSPNDKVKWGFGVDDEYLDPVWASIVDVGDFLPMISNYNVKVLNCDIIEDTNYKGYNFSCGGVYENGGWVGVTINFTKRYSGLKNESPDKKKEKSVYHYKDDKYNYKFKSKEEVKKLGKDWKVKKYKQNKEWEPINGTWKFDSEEYLEDHGIYEYKNDISIGDVSSGDVWRIGSASTVVNFTTSDVLVNNSVNDVFIYDNGTVEFYLIASMGGFDVVFKNGSSYDNFYSNTSYAPSYQILADDGLLYVDDGSNFQNYSFVNFLYSNALSREDNLWFKSDATYWTNTTGFCYNNTGLNFDFVCGNFTSLSGAQAIAATDTLVFVGVTDSGVFRYNHTTFVNDLNFTVASSQIAGNSDNVTSLDITGNKLAVGTR